MAVLTLLWYRPPARQTSSSAAAIKLDHDLDRFPFVHRPVAVGHLVEAHDPVEDSARFDFAFEDVWQKLFDVRADRGGPAAHGGVPSAWGTRSASACAPSATPVPKKPPWMHDVCSPSWQRTQVPSE